MGVPALHLSGLEALVNRPVKGLMRMKASCCLPSRDSIVSCLVALKEPGLHKSLESIYFCSFPSTKVGMKRDFQSDTDFPEKLFRNHALNEVAGVC